jgi:cytochrome P450
MGNAYPPGPNGGFFSGTVHQLRHNRLQFLTSLRDSYGDIVHFRAGLQHAYLLNHLDYIQQVLVKQPDSFYKSEALKRNTRKSIGNGLLTSEGEFHKRQRRLVQPALHHHRIETYAQVMVDHTLRMLGGWCSGEQHDIHHDMMELTMQIVARTLFGSDVSADASALGKAITLGIETISQRITQPLHLPDWLPTPRNNERRAASRLIEATITGMIDQRRASGEDTGDLLSMLLLAVDEDDGGQMTNKQVRDEAMTLFIAGHETTANALSWALCLLSQHPEVEARLLAELDEALGGRAPTLHDLPQLRYAEMIIKETLRLYPPAWAISRIAMEEVVVGSYSIPKRSVILLSPFVMHRDRRYFEQPEMFQPERFSEDNEERIPKYAYFPFGGGPRVCIGNQFAMIEATLVLATIVQRYRLALAPGQTIVPEPLVTLRPRDGIQMILTQREVPEPVMA